MAWLLATCPNEKLRNGSRAVKLAERAVQLSHDPKPETLDALAAANAEVGRFTTAVTAARRALELARQQNNRTLATALQARIAQYEAEKPFHLTSSPWHGPTTK